MRRKTRNILLYFILSILAIIGIIHLSDQISNTAPNSSMVPIKIASSSNALWADHYNSLDAMITSADIIASGKVVNSYTKQRLDLIFTKQDIESE